MGAPAWKEPDDVSRTGRVRPGRADEEDEGRADEADADADEEAATPGAVGGGACWAPTGRGMAGVEIGVLPVVINNGHLQR